MKCLSHRNLRPRSNIFAYRLIEGSANPPQDDAICQALNLDSTEMMSEISLLLSTFEPGKGPLASESPASPLPLIR